jgi:hypothetical protein
MSASSPSIEPSIACPDFDILSDNDKWAPRLVLHHLGYFVSSVAAFAVSRGRSFRFEGKLRDIPCDMSRFIAMVAVFATQQTKNKKDRV